MGKADMYMYMYIYLLGHSPNLEIVTTSSLNPKLI